ncbi:MAG: type II secretion system protein GspM [Sideroxydans sp.]|nr:type II secretion system protein GspM [Sideroxydans sp.]
MNTNQLRDALRNFWSAREVREQRMLLAAACVIAVALLYLLLIAPALSARQKLTKTLPQLREQTALMQALTSQATALQASNNAPVAAMSSASIEASLQAQQLKARNITMLGASAQVQLDAASFAQTLAWLTSLQSGARITVIAAKITPLANPDQVDASFTLQAAGAGE